MERAITVGLVEDQLLFRQGMKSIIGSWPEMSVVFESPDGFSVEERLRNSETVPDVMLVDLSLPPDGKRDFSGVEVTDFLRANYPSMGVIVLSLHEDDNFIALLIEHGAHGYLIKDSDPEEVRNAITSVHSKGSYINERTLKAIQKSIGKKISTTPFADHGKRFTRRELEVLELICHQLTSEEIGEKLFISIKTVNGHRNNLLQKTGARNTAGLVVFAITNRIVDPVFPD